MPTQDARGIMEARQYLGSRAVRHVTAAATIKAFEHIVYITLPGASTYVITLPPVNECFGIYCFVVTVDGAGTCTIADSDEAMIDYTSDALTQLGDHVILFTEGLQWYQLKELTT